MDRPKDLKEYVLTLRRFNPSVSDTDISVYLSSIGYSPEEIAKELIVDEPRLESGVHLGIDPSHNSVSFDSENKVLASVDNKVVDTDTNVVPETTSFSNYPLIPKDTKKVYQNIDINPLNGNKKLDLVGDSLLSDKDKVLDKSFPIPKKESLSSLNLDSKKDVPEILDRSTKTTRSRKLKYLIGGLFFVIAVFGYIYFIHGVYIFVRPPLSGNSLKSDVLLKVFSSKLGYNGKFTYDVNTVDRDPFNLNNFIDELNNFSSDESTLKNIAIVHSKVSDFIQKNKKMPESLGDINFSGNAFSLDSFAFGTTTVNGEGDFFISTTMLTPAGVKVALESGAEKVGDLTIKFFGSNPPPFYPKKVYSEFLSKFEFLKSETEFENLFKDKSMLQVSAKGNLGDNGNIVSYSDIGLDFSSEDFKVDTKFEFMTDGQDNFLKLKEFPKSIFDISSIEDSWINLKDDGGVFNLKDLLPDFILSSIDNSLKLKELSDSVMLFLKKSDQYELFRFVGEPKRIKSDGKSLFQYEIEIDKVALSKIIKEVFSKEGAGLDAEIDSVAFNDLVDFINRNKRILISVDSSGILKYVFISSSLYPQISQSSSVLGVDINFEVYFDKSLDQANTPDKSITLKDMYKKISGLSDQEFDLLLQVKTVEEIRKSLNIYYRLTGGFPDSLSKLVTPVSKLVSTTPPVGASNNVNIVVGSPGYYLAMFGDRPILDSIPKSVYKDDQFVYTQKTKDSYSLQYKIEPVTFSKKVSEIIVGDVQTKNGKNIKHLLIREGNNIANELTISDESSRTAIDSDIDGLSDSLELIFGTDSKLKDTNKDGVSDYNSFMNSLK